MNRPIAPLQDAFWQACEQMLMDHTYPGDLDAALVAWGYAMGPCEAQDLVGLDAVLAARSGSTPAPILGRMVAEERFGKVNGSGFYRYLADGGAVVDPLIDDLIRQEAQFANRVRDELKGVEIVVRLHGMVGPVLRSDRDGAVALLHVPRTKLDLL